ncbi:MAG TPA: CDC27 family protein [Bacteriovoracaceae bacterium]|nr:CDC27 family protein [Bacteriovoracaceae bacterium]
MYKKNPRSKVFAPLAESFRKLGMLDDALKILKDGIRNHPNYPLGYIVLAHCYYDQQKYELTYNTLRPIATQNADNISMQKIFAQACIHLGYLEEALDTYKYLLFISPKDKFFAEQVKKLEDDLMVGHKKLSLEQLIKAPDMPVSNYIETSDDDWVQVDFNQKNEESLPQPVTPIPLAPIAEDEWVMKKPGFSDHPILQNEEIQKRDLEDDYYADEFEEELGNIEEVNAQSVSLESPLVSHTLIDLYCAQEYYDKALELLEKIIELNPQDQTSITKIKQVKKLREEKKPGLRVVTEQDGHDELISIIETQVKARSPKELIIEAKFHTFLEAIKERAQENR